ncbi:hypothetical protein GJAV_G00050020 [Gymnothorax javanicus]|nr:hypothetical protein GJAV_G00050020 [Gymnothorax javanicus]
MERGHCCPWIAVFAVLFLCKHSCAEWNVTQEPANRSVPCGPHGNRSNCTEIITTAKWSGHFTKCPQDYTHYCIHGKCRFVHEQDTPSCICPKGYIGPSAIINRLHLHLHTAEKAVWKEEKRRGKHRGKTEHDEQHQRKWGELIGSHGNGRNAHSLISAVNSWSCPVLVTCAGLQTTKRRILSALTTLHTAILPNIPCSPPSGPVPLRPALFPSILSCSHVYTHNRQEQQKDEKKSLTHCFSQLSADFAP